MTDVGAIERPRSRIPAHNPTAEKNLIGAAMVRAGVVEEALAAGMTPEAIYTTRLQHAWAAITALHRRGQNINPITVADELRRDGLLEQFGNQADLTALQSQALPSSGARSWAEIIVGCRVRRREQELGTELALRAELGEDTAGIIEELRSVHTLPSEQMFHPWSAADLLAADRTFRWRIRGCMVNPTFGQLGGEEKTLKTYLGTMMDVAVATGTAFLGRFEVDEPAPVLSYIGEGGRIPFTRRLERITLSMGINPGDLGDTMRFSFDTAPILSERFSASLARDLEVTRPGLVSIDPLYMFHGVNPGQSNGSNLFEEGPILRSVQAPCEEAGACLRITHHYNGQGGNGISRLSQAGSKQWVDSWWLVSHRERPDVDNGEFKLLLSIGSRQWGGADWDIDMHIGRFDPDLGEYDGTITWDVRRHTGETTADTGSSKTAQRILDTLDERPWELTKTQLYDLVRGNRDVFDITLDALIDADKVGVQPIKRAENGKERTRKLYGPTPQPQPANGPGWSESDLA